MFCITFLFILDFTYVDRWSIPEFDLDEVDIEVVYRDPKVDNVKMEEEQMDNEEGCDAATDESKNDIKKEEQEECKDVSDNDKKAKLAESLPRYNVYKRVSLMPEIPNPVEEIKYDFFHTNLSSIEDSRKSVGFSNPSKNTEKQKKLLNKNFPRNRKPSNSEIYESLLSSINFDENFLKLDSCLSNSSSFSSIDDESSNIDRLDFKLSESVDVPAINSNQCKTTYEIINGVKTYVRIKEDLNNSRNNYDRFNVLRELYAAYGKIADANISQITLPPLSSRYDILQAITTKCFSIWNPFPNFGHLQDHESVMCKSIVPEEEKATNSYDRLLFLDWDLCMEKGKEEQIAGEDSERKEEIKKITVTERNKVRIKTDYGKAFKTGRSKIEYNKNFPQRSQGTYLRKDAHNLQKSTSNISNSNNVKYLGSNPKTFFNIRYNSQAKLSSKIANVKCISSNPEACSNSQTKPSNKIATFPELTSDFTEEDILSFLNGTGWIVSKCDPQIDYQSPPHATSPTVVPKALQEHYGNTGSDVVLWNIADKNCVILDPNQVPENPNLKSKKSKQPTKLQPIHFNPYAKSNVPKHNTNVTFQNWNSSQKKNPKLNKNVKDELLSFINRFDDYGRLTKRENSPSKEIGHQIFGRRTSTFNRRIQNNAIDKELPDDDSAYKQLLESGLNDSTCPPTKLPLQVYTPPPPLKQDTSKKITGKNKKKESLSELKKKSKQKNLKKESLPKKIKKKAKVREKKPPPKEKSLKEKADEQLVSIIKNSSKKKLPDFIFVKHCNEAVTYQNTS